MELGHYYWFGWPDDRSGLNKTNVCALCVSTFGHSAIQLAK